MLADEVVGDEYVQTFQVKPDDGQTPERTIRARQSSMRTTTAHSAASPGWWLVLRRLGSYATWSSAFKIQALVFRNAAGSVACAWITSACCALGNIFSGKWYTEQSRDELMLANCAWCALTFCTVLFSAFLFSMPAFQFLRIPDGRPSLWFCWKRLVRATAGYFCVTMGLIIAFNYLVVYLISIAPGLFKYRLDCYVDTLAMIGYIAGIARAAVKIFHEETRQGRERLQRKQQKRLTPRRSQVFPDKGTPVPQARRLSLREAPRFQTPTFWKAYVKVLPIASSPFLACVFVHILSRQRIMDASSPVLTGVVIASIAFKLAVQELAKHYIFKKGVRSARLMSVLVGIPTVLIDTQTRIILLGTNSTRTATLGAIGMALIEISLRSAKAALLMWQIKHRKVKLERRNTGTLQRQTTVETFHVDGSESAIPRGSNALRPSLSTRKRDFDLWRQQALTFHLAELNADMYAEYISIGCSASILFFYGNHPHYELLRQSGTADTTAAKAVAWRMNQLGMLALQIGVEIGVDYASIVLEVVIGIEFEHAKKHALFLAAVFMVAAVINSTISIGFYLS